MVQHHRIAALIAVALAWPTPARATTVDPFAWQELVLDADFVGIVDCVTAGGPVARFRVIDPWKGAESRNASFTVELPGDIALVGERYLIAAWRAAIPGRIQSYTQGVDDPLQWRELHTDYRVSLAGGLARIRMEAGVLVGSFDHLHTPRVSDFKRQAQALLRLDGPARELERVRALARKYLHFDGEPWRDEPLTGRTARQHRASLLYGRMLAARSVASAIRIARSGAAADPELRWQVEATLRALPAPPAAEDETEDDLTAPESRQQTRITLTELLAWEEPPSPRQRSPRGYLLGSWFCFRCDGAHCADDYARLTTARDPFVRVAGATYLAMVDPPAGTAALRQLAHLPGDPGAWAAFELARRGDATAVPRALDLLTDPIYLRSNVAYQLGRQLLVLLSNSAHAAGVPQPELDRWQSPKDLRAWWSHHRGALRVHDPWLAELVRQRVD